MLARVLDLPSVKNNKSKFLGYVKQINNGKFKVSRKLANKIKVSALNLQFKEVEGQNTVGGQIKALGVY